MGDVFGSFGFDLVAQDIYEAVLSQHQQVIARALTDDLNMAIPPASLPDTLATAANIFNLVRDESLRIAGLRLNSGKCFLLLPPDEDGSHVDATQITASSPQDFPPDLTIVTDGLKICGAPIGTDEFCRS